jgi:hypothetical protein
VADIQGQAAQNAGRQLGPGAAVGCGILRTRRTSQGNEQRGDTQHGGVTRFGFVYDLGQKCPERNGRSKHRVLASTKVDILGRKGRGDLFGGQDLGERQSWLVEEGSQNLLEAQTTPGRCI